MRYNISTNIVPQRTISQGKNKMCACDSLHTVLFVHAVPGSQELHYWRYFLPNTHTWIYFANRQLFCCVEGRNYTLKEKSLQGVFFTKVFRKVRFFFTLYSPHARIKMSVFIVHVVLKGKIKRGRINEELEYLLFLLISISTFLHVDECTSLFQRKLA